MSAPGAEALDAIERVLVQRPQKDDRALASATERLAEFREELIRTDADRGRLAHLNGILSVVIGMHFPLGNAPWDELEKARGWLAQMLEMP